MNTLDDYQQRFLTFYPSLLPKNKNHLGQVYQATEYSFAAGGKRLRPALVYALADSLDINLKRVDILAFAVECIHTYSLIHDDLPAMDDDDLRRGRPACHKQFNEATAILAGDALNTFAFELLATHYDGTPAEQRLKQIQLLANCSGIDGMVGGQDMDLSCEQNKRPIDLPTLSQLHLRKTAKLIEASMLLPYLAADKIDNQRYQLLSEAAQSIGLFYQIQDDILDVTQPSETLGKPSGSDIENGKSTYVSLLGLTAAQTEARQLSQRIHDKLEQFFDPNIDYKQTPLYQIVEQIVIRQH